MKTYESVNVAPYSQDRASHTIAVAPYAVESVPTDRRIEAMMKHNDCPVAEIIKRARRPNLSTVYPNVSSTGKTPIKSFAYPERDERGNHVRARGGTAEYKR